MKQKRLTIRLGVLTAILVLTSAAFLRGQRAGDLVKAQETMMQPAHETSPTVAVHVFDEKGELVGPVRSPRQIKTDAQWKDELSAQQYRILRKAGTERAGTGALLKNKRQGVYTCAGCGLPLYFSHAKFESNTGWPSFFEAVAPGNVAEKSDTALGMVRTEVLCARCGGHLGHVFDDGPAPTGMRHCLNSGALTFTPSDQTATLADPAAKQTPIDQLATAVFAGGCFWCTEAVFEPVRGVVEVVSGYAGDTQEAANYALVSSGATQHAEAIKITYDPAMVSYDTLLDLFFNVAHDPTQLNRQGNDHGKQYRSTVFFANDTQQQATEAYIKQLDESGKFNAPIVTTLEPLTEFYLAEPYHQDYARLNPSDSYIRHIALPKVDKLQKKYGELLKDQGATDQAGE